MATVLYNNSCNGCSGRGYKSGETTIANVGRICTVRSVGISVDINPFEPHILASNMAHAIGHNLGFAHDDRSGSTGKGPVHTKTALASQEKGLCARRVKGLHARRSLWLHR